VEEKENDKPVIIFNNFLKSFNICCLIELLIRFLLLEWRRRKGQRRVTIRPSTSATPPDLFSEIPETRIRSDFKK
jgi:hypothetical protein